ncbi:ACI13 protein [Gossypium australe]|uniref:ACI13 protein n=2 Tax=Gossypium TaxID=3633 RepID=A0A5B6US61_9ROSI|nr:ACI13 protein [Gossypium australe]
MTSNPTLLPEIGPDGLAREPSVIAYTEKERLQLTKYIAENYSKIHDIERELANLTMEMKLTAGPKKAALEHMRKKIEMSTERIRIAKEKEEQARKAWESASKALHDEEAIKQKLCEDLNNLVQESSNSQFARLEELKRRLEALNPSKKSTFSDHVSFLSISPSIQYSNGPLCGEDNCFTMVTRIDMLADVKFDKKEGIRSAGSARNCQVQQLNIILIMGKLDWKEPVKYLESMIRVEMVFHYSYLPANDMKAIGLTQHAATIGVSSVPPTTESGSTVSTRVPQQGNGGNVQVMNGQNQLATNDGEVKGKKKNTFQGRGKGIGAVPKSRGSAAPGWTGAGFDVDART